MNSECALCEFEKPDDPAGPCFAPESMYPVTVCLGCSPYYEVSNGEMVLIDDLPPHVSSEARSQ